MRAEKAGTHKSAALFSLVCLLAMSAAAREAEAARTESLVVQAVFQETLRIEVLDLGFNIGVISKPTAGTGNGWVTITPDSVRTSSPNIARVTTGRAARIRVFGKPGRAIQWIVPPSIRVTSENGGSMIISTLWDGDEVLGPDPGRAFLDVGGTFVVAAQQPTGLYSGEFQVGVTYE